MSRQQNKNWKNAKPKSFRKPYYWRKSNKSELEPRDRRQLLAQNQMMVAKLKESNPVTEFELQAQLYRGISDGTRYRVRGELKFEGVKLDLAVFCGGEPVRIIEVKRNKPSYPQQYHEQCQAYRSFGVPVDIVCGQSDVNKYLKYLKDHGSLREPDWQPFPAMSICKQNEMMDREFHQRLVLEQYAELAHRGE